MLDYFDLMRLSSLPLNSFLSNMFDKTRFMAIYTENKSEGNIGL